MDEPLKRGGTKGRKELSCCRGHPGCSRQKVVLESAPELTAAKNKGVISFQKGKGEL